MAPPRARGNGDDSRNIETTTGRERHATASSSAAHASAVTKGKRPTGIHSSHGAGQHVVGRDSKHGIVHEPPHSAKGEAHPTGSNPPGINWTEMPTATLRAYRHSHHLHVPSGYATAHSQLVLNASEGPGRRAPSMARPRDTRRVPLDTLAAAVRKDFNAAAISEMEVVTSFLYAIRNQDKKFRMQFGPARTR